MSALETAFDKARLAVKSVIERKAAAWKVGASRRLTVVHDGAWDGSAAAEGIFTHAGFNDGKPDPTKARLGFLAYDSANPTVKGSYKLPFARIEGGELKAIAGGVRAAASRLTQTDIPTAVQDDARKVLDHYMAEITND